MKMSNVITVLLIVTCAHLSVTYGGMFHVLSIANSVKHEIILIILKFNLHLTEYTLRLRYINKSFNVLE
jgi:hypothetical protein